MREFNGKVALITGSSSGIGEAIALKLSKLGSNIVITGRNENRIENVVEKCQKVAPNSKFIGVRAELTNDEDIKQLVDKTVQEFGRIDTLVINAGLLRVSKITDPDYIQLFDEMFAMKVRSVQVLTKLVIPYLIESKGNVVNISGIHAERPHTQFMAFCMAESAMDMFTKCLALELGPKGVRCNSVLPSIVRTPLLGPAADVCAEYCKQWYPLERICEVEDVANLVAFLVSPNASFITGAMIPVDGGFGVAAMPEMNI